MNAGSPGISLNLDVNNATYEAESLSSGGNDSGESSIGLSGIGTGRDDGDANSTTVAAISGLAGNQNARTGDAETGIAPIFDADRVRQDVEAQTTITQEFGAQASQAWGDYASQQEAQLWREAQNASDPETRAALLKEASRWAEGGAYRTSGHTLLGLAGGGVDGATGALTSSVFMAEVERLTDELNLPDEARQGLESLTATLAGAATGGTQGGAMAFNLDANNRQLHSFEQSLAEELAEGSEYTPEQIADALRAMHNDELEESPGSNLIVDLQDEDAVDDTYFDYGGEWIGTDGEANTMRYLIQMIPENTSPELISYIIEQTGGEGSPYRAPIYQLPPEEAAPGQPRDRLTGRPLDEATLESVDWSQDPDTIARAEVIGSVTRTFVDLCAIHPGALPCRGVAFAITGSDVTGKVSDGDVPGALVQGGAFLAGQSTASIVKGSIQKTGVYSREFIEWAKNIYGAGTGKIIQGIYDEKQSVPDTDNE